MFKRKTKLSQAVTLSLLSLSVSSTVNAAGFQLAEYSATGLGRAYAGEAAIADNAGSQWRNPAMMTYLKGTQVSVGAIYVDPNVDVDGTVTYTDYSTGTPNQTKSASSSDFANSAVIPNIYLSHQLNDNIVLGLAAGTNYGMETDLGKDFSASHFGNEASVITKEINANIAYKLNDAFSLGGGLRYVIGEGSFGATTPSHLPSTPTHIGGGNFLPAAGTTLKYMEGDDTSYGWQVGAAWQVNDDHRIGFAYKSEVLLELEGHAEGAGFGLATGAQKNGKMDLTLPATAELASYHQLTEKLAIHASFNWTDWSSFEKLEAEFADGPSMVKVENWEDNYRLALGTTYQLDNKLVVRGGIAYDTSAVNDKNRTITIPETDRLWFSAGAGYQWSEQLTLDAGVTYIAAKDADIKESRGYASDDEAQAVGGQFVGTTTGHIWLVGVQASYTF
ncbi:outer membrane protein transport protein [Vibrio sp. Of7-15]|uniref:outer membrane protein transport protein n=1 Tax=Vibrio sp. Of7-15 TaxID=2724879 RepID=UPI001EF36FB9|nr:outer membrane protein transport protein [Vibrio sp. Of7-15]MCG7499116.1 outer membrane protein transport protein [Vibrio sp. Of7-15]